MKAIAIDLGGTKIEGILATKTGRVLKKVRIATETPKGKQTVIRNLVRVIQDLQTKDVRGVGISMPGCPVHGDVTFAGGTLTCLQGVHLARVLSKKVTLPVYLANDANCFALAEAIYGAGKGARVVLGVIWGTGIGCGIVIDKNVVEGAMGCAGEFGHAVVDPTIVTGSKCACGQQGCLEMLASGKNIIRRYYAAQGQIKNATPKEIFASRERVAKKVMTDAIRYFGLGIAGLINTINPDVVVLGGGVSNLPASAYAALRREVKKYALKIPAQHAKIVRHKLGDVSGALGAAALVFEVSV